MEYLSDLIFQVIKSLIQFVWIIEIALGANWINPEDLSNDIQKVIHVSFPLARLVIANSRMACMLT